MSPLEDQLFQEVLSVYIFFNEVVLVVYKLLRGAYGTVFVEANVIKSGNYIGIA